ncbi:ankyrin repeat domain-containing protein [Chryseobacterium sp. Alg-005]|uniref:ankyrin repeat domain-containing protein n=1 Tax=Chryseobacterium sp. Alg-005 TaxID=3159516 RepID=UPI0035558313
MKVLFFFLFFSMMNACGMSDKNSMKNGMQQNVIDLVKENNVEGVKIALERGADVNTRDKSKRSLLLIATVNKQVEMAKLLVSFNADVNQQDDHLDSPFLYAGASGQTELVKLFLKNGARFDIFNRYNGTALIPACERGHVETVAVLANTKAFPINHVNRLGWTALMEAVILGDGSQKYQEIVTILKNRGADLTIPDKDGITPLQHAKSLGFKEIVKILES